MKFELKIPEDHLEEFETWFDQHHPAPSKREVTAFVSTGPNAVTYTVLVSLRSATAAEAVMARWALVAGQMPPQA